MTCSVLVLGAGPCGLSVALEARRTALAATLVEREAQVGGLARTFSRDGFQMDLSIHRVQDRDLGQALQDLRRVAPKSIHLHLQGRRLTYPPGPRTLLELPMTQLARAAASLLRSRLTARAISDPSYRDWFVARYGAVLHGQVVQPLMLKQWGISTDQIDVALAHHRRLSLRPGRGVPSHFLHGSQGADVLMQQVAWRSGAGLLLGRAVVRVRHAAGRVQDVELSDGTRLPVETLVSTIPLPLLVRCLDPPLPQTFESLARVLRYRALVVVGLMLRRERVGVDHVTYFPEARYPFTRTFEPKNASRSMAPSGRTLIGFELPCFEGDALWRTGDEELRRRMAGFGSDVGFDPGEVEGAMVVRVPQAYPLYDLGFEARVGALLQTLHGQLSNLFLVGRNALFRLDNMHHAFAMGRDVARHVAAGGDAASWHAGLKRYEQLSYID